VLICFWLLQLEPATHAPVCMPRGMWSQIVADVDLESVYAAVQSLRQRWKRFCYQEPEHPLVRAIISAASAAPVVFTTVGPIHLYSL
jgi:hypothetical protein